MNSGSSKYKNLISHIAVNGISNGAIARFLGVTGETFRLKCRGDSRFYLDEAIKIRDKFFPDSDLESLFDTDDMKAYRESENARTNCE